MQFSKSESQDSPEIIPTTEVMTQSVAQDILSLDPSLITDKTESTGVKEEHKTLC